MALLKPLPTPYGAVATYHHVAESVWDKSIQSIRVGIASYISPEARKESMLPVARSWVTLTEQPAPLTLPDIYKSVRSDPTWADAKDDV